MESESLGGIQKFTINRRMVAKADIQPLLIGFPPWPKPKKTTYNTITIACLLEINTSVGLLLKNIKVNDILIMNIHRPKSQAMKKSGNTPNKTAEKIKILFFNHPPSTKGIIDKTNGIKYKKLPGKSFFR